MRDRNSASDDNRSSSKSQDSAKDLIGHILLPIEIAGPLLINEKLHKIVVTGCDSGTISNINRGSIAINKSGGVSAFVIEERTFHLYVAKFASAGRAATALNWLINPDNDQKMKELFGRTSHYAQLVHIEPKVASKYLFIKFIAEVDENRAPLILEGIKETLDKLREYFPDIESLFPANDLRSFEGKPLTDRAEGREFHVVAEALIHSNTIKDVLKTTVSNLVEMNMERNLFKNAVIGTLGSLKPEISRVISAIFMSIGQDLTKAFKSCKCTLTVEAREENKDILHVTCTMPSIEIATINPDDLNETQIECLHILDLGEYPTKQLSEVLCSAVMATELTYLASLSNQ